MRSGRGEGIGATTGLVALLGHPVAHSLSPAIHNAAFASEGLDLVYLAFDVAPDYLPAAIEGLRRLGAVGANLTVPHKQSVLPLLDELDQQARAVGAVNTIVRREDRLLGYNTDVDGFLAALQAAWGRSVEGTSCLLLGAGGAARAVLAALTREGAAEVLVYNRTPIRAERLCAEAEGWSATLCRPVTRDDLGRRAGDVDLIVNATSAGLGVVKESPLPADIVTARHFVMDLVYGSEVTPFLEYAASRGARVLDGREMLVQQAARAFELWTGRRAPLLIMREQLEK
jgi:shikimate dehydrogenase